MDSILLVNKSTGSKGSKIQHGVRFILPYNSPLSVSIPKSYGKRGDEHSNCSISCIFWGMSIISASVSNVEICLLLLFGKCLLHMCRHKNIYNLGVKSYVLFSKNLLGLQKCRQHLKVRNFALFMYGKMQESSR